MTITEKQQKRDDKDNKDNFHIIRCSCGKRIDLDIDVNEDQPTFLCPKCGIIIGGNGADYVDPVANIFAEVYEELDKKKS